MRRGFSLMEVMVSLGLITLLLGIVSQDRQQVAVGRQPLAAAQLLQAELERAHRQAISQQVPVAIAFPASTLVQSFYRLEGNAPSGPSWSQRFDRELPQAYLCLGGWTPTSGAAVSALVPKLASSGDGRDWSLWTNPVSAADPYLLFCPNGSVLSNGFPYFSGAYHLVVCNGAQVTPGASASDWQIQSISHPQTVTISLSGQSWLEPGVADASLPAFQGGGAASPPLAPGRSQAAAQNPVLVSQAAEPTPPEASRSLIFAGDHVVLSTTARSPDGSPLRCHWEAGGGQFSSPGRELMSYQPDDKTYTCVWEWRPDPNGSPAEHTLTCVLESQLGGSTSTTLQVGVEATSSQYCYCRGFDTTPDLWFVERVRSNGTGQRIIHEFSSLEGECPCSPVVPSPVLNKLAIATIGYGGSSVGGIYICNPDGSDFRKIAIRRYATPSPSRPDNFGIMEPVWAPDKKSIVYNSLGASGFYDLMLVDFRQPTPTPVTLVPGNSEGDCFFPQFTADSQHLVYVRGVMGGYSTPVTSNTYKLETCDWTAPGYPTRVLYTNPADCGITWGKANRITTAAGTCLYVANGPAPGGSPGLTFLGNEANGLSSWGPGGAGHGISFLGEFDPMTGPGTEVLKNLTYPVPSSGVNMVQCQFSPTGDHLAGQVWNPDFTRDIVVTNAQGTSPPITVASLKEGGWMWDTQNFVFSGDGRWIYYTTWDWSHPVADPAISDWQIWAVPVDGSKPPQRITRYRPGLCRRIF